jgi:hypothetical protein
VGEPFREADIYISVPGKGCSTNNKLAGLKKVFSKSMMPRQALRKKIYEP